MTEARLRLALSTSLLSAVAVPLVGLASAPILTNTVGAEGRGEVAAAIAPNVLILAVAAMGLPESLTYHLANRPHRSQRAFVIATSMTIALGIGLALATLPLLGILSGGNAGLARITWVATLVAVPALATGTLRAVAAAQQLWYRIAVERTVGALARLAALVVLLLSDRLTVTTAVLVIVLAPFVSNTVYVPIMFRRPAKLDEREDIPLVRALAGYGVRTWVGSIAGILLARLGVLLFTPLSNSTELGLYVVGVTISDLPVVLSLAAKDALFGVNARTRDAEQFAAVSRVSFLVGLLGSSLIALTLPLWIGFVFGEEFRSAIPTTWLLLGCAVANVPTFILAAGTGAWGRPGVRSTGLVLTLLVDVVAFVLFVPTFGAIGAASANFLSASFGAVFSLIGTGRVIGVPVRRLLIPQVDDLRALHSHARAVLRFGRREA